MLTAWLCADCVVGALFDWKGDLRPRAPLLWRISFVLTEVALASPRLAKAWLVALCVVGASLVWPGTNPLPILMLLWSIALMLSDSALAEPNLARAVLIADCVVGALLCWSVAKAGALIRARTASVERMRFMNRFL